MVKWCTAREEADGQFEAMLFVLAISAVEIDSSAIKGFTFDHRFIEMGIRLCLA